LTDFSESYFQHSEQLHLRGKDFVNRIIFSMQFTFSPVEGAVVRRQVEISQKLLIKLRQIFAVYFYVEGLNVCQVIAEKSVIQSAQWQPLILSLFSYFFPDSH